MVASEAYILSSVDIKIVYHTERLPTDTLVYPLAALSVKQEPFGYPVGG